jgi:acetoin utilization deacetylase AcuC-like enzyme
MPNHAFPSTGYLFEEEFLNYELGFLHPECPDRLSEIRRELAESGLEMRLTKLSPIPDPLPHIRRIHTAPHIASIQRQTPIGAIAALAAAGACAAVKAVCEGTVRNAFCAIRPPGHHALNTGVEEGFCFYNNVAIAARYGQEVHKCSRVLIVDWDFHHGNGTEAAFYDDPTVLYFSTHHLFSYPGTGDSRRTGKGKGGGFNINVPMPTGAGDEEFGEAFRTVLTPAADAFKPELVLISAGFDARRGDRLGCFDLTDDGFAELTAMVMDIAHQYAGGRLVSMLEGGYTPPDLATAVASHVRTLLEWNRRE